MHVHSRFAVMLSALPLCLLSVCLPARAQTTPPMATRPMPILAATVRSESLMFEKDLLALANRIAVKLGSSPTKTTVVSSSNPPVSRMRVVAALVKLMVAPDSLEAYKTETPEGMPEDVSLIPDDMMPYIAAAVSEGWLTKEPLKGRQTATYGFVRNLLSHIPTLGIAPDKPKSAPKEDKTLTQLKTDEIPTQETEAKTSGLIIDAMGFKVERSMSPRILDADGNVVYPDQAHVPDPDTVLDKGILDYTLTLEKSRRAGDKPLVIKAIKSDFKDIYVSNEDAAKIRQANKRAKFIETWQVCILSDN